MVYAGIETKIICNNGLWVKTADLDAAAEEGAVVDVTTLGFIPNRVSLIVQRTGGTQATINVDVEASVDGTTYASLAGVTAKDTIDTAADIAPYRYFKLTCTDEGSGNTLDAYWSIAA